MQPPISSSDEAREWLRRARADLRELGEQIAARDTPLGEIVEAAYPLTEFASRFRYPGAPCEPDAGEASSGMTVAERVVAAIRAKLPESASSPGTS